ncbi:trypsin Inhibitor like cysteine rich domain protein [Ancylostoma ceylanicum]|uniref:Trypsin Inhibitor like cysteine rich domain protein n=1 Tax=Ancylostoma ceylanicum TaxID=53326 RepID=A0A0D6LGS8_9BILA|nr:trypsin Inhibitor like cysteine rich domain protein [Ancylostoma ceylanicum]
MSLLLKLLLIVSMQITLALVSVLILISTATARRGPGGFQCGPNEERKACGTHCEPTCAVPNPINCPRGCVPNVCQCRIGFIRDSYNNCIRRSACPPNRPNPPNRPYPPNRPGGGGIGGIGGIGGGGIGGAPMMCGPHERWMQCSTCEPTCANMNPATYP